MNNPNSDPNKTILPVSSQTTALSRAYVLAYPEKTLYTRRMKRWLISDGVALAAIAVVISLFFFRLFFPHPQLITTPDFGLSDAVSNFSTKYFLGSELANHRIPLWSP